MAIKKQPTIVVLGAGGMLGHAVYAQLKKTFTHVHGVNRKTFHAHRPVESFAKLRKKIGKIDFIINCIGKLNTPTQTSKETEEYIKINGLFPQVIATLAEKHHFNVLHFSTDAVFGPLVKNADETTPISPQGIYGLSKAMGEAQSPRVLNFRGSLLGVDATNRRGLLELVLAYPNNTVNGYTDQLWTGCTSLQFAQLCAEIIHKNLFEGLRKRSSTFHFAPLGPVTKYEILALTAKLSKNNAHVKKVRGGRMTRSLQSNYANIAPFKPFYKNSNLQQAILQLIDA